MAIVGARLRKLVELINEHGLASVSALDARLVGWRGSFYGITALYRKNKQPLMEDLPKLFTLLQEKQLALVIAHRLPLLAVRRSQELLLAVGATGEIAMLRELGLS